MQIIFWAGVYVSLYSYLLYPLLLRLLLVRQNAGAPLSSAVSRPPAITVIITARNEGSRIRDKLENTLGLRYPRNLLTVMVASDASTDDTDHIVESYADRNVVLARSSERKGKEYAQLCAIQKAQAPVLVFTDAATRLESDALELLA